jgi:hypothetical protein
MAERVATLFVDLLYLYGGIGTIFAIAFVLIGVKRIDPQALGTGWGFRLLIVPGSVAFWPVLLMRWALGPHDPPEERNPHR